ncbi:hypothetical protein BUALT_Bualt06G0002400 [Buddleja alternifolia]|uniref:peroxidase n=1 Tax=Buddleja alternifolia TaxID=168488 RepID=A0AAV6XIF8_9LAMI|nr:hypothetical protein BUALT_Bualt06G0002400 [Buddleja alternifolia]
MEPPPTADNAGKAASSDVNTAPKLLSYAEKLLSNSLPPEVWPDLPRKLSSKVLTQSMIGKPLKLDEATTNIANQLVARICVELNVLDKLQPGIPIQINDKDANGLQDKEKPNDINDQDDMLSSTKREYLKDNVRQYQNNHQEENNSETMGQKYKLLVSDPKTSKRNTNGSPKGNSVRESGYPEEICRQRELEQVVSSPTANEGNQVDVFTLGHDIGVPDNGGIDIDSELTESVEQWQEGCDGSVLLDGPNSEKESIPNKGSLRGFEVIDAAKAELELKCPGIVSCADIVAFAARDSSWKVGKIYYDVPSGRRDGRVSLINEPLQELPPPFVNATALRDNFARKGLSLDEMVTLSGAHSIGVSHCSSFSGRLYPTVDPTLDPKFADSLKRSCPPPPVNATAPPAVDPTVNLDSLTPTCLDNKYYTGLKAKRGVLITDQVLLSSSLTSKMVLYNAQYGSVWAKKFAAAMVHMGNIEVLTGKNGEIRKKCRFVN